MYTVFESWPNFAISIITLTVVFGTNYWLNQRKKKKDRWMQEQIKIMKELSKKEEKE